MSALRDAVRAASRFAAIAAIAAATALALAAAPTPARAQDDAGTVVSDTVFAFQPRAPISFSTDYSHDQSRGSWGQSLSYARAYRNLAVGINGSSNTSEDVLASGSRVTTGDFSGRLDWRAARDLIFSMNGLFSMSSIADGLRASTADQHRNSLSVQSQYTLKLPFQSSLLLTGSSEFQRNFDLRVTERKVFGASGTPDSIAAQRDSSYASGRLDGVRAQLTVPVLKGLTFGGKVFGSRNRPTTTIRTIRSSNPVDGTAGVDSVNLRSIQLPVDNSVLDGALTFDRIRGTKATLSAARSGLDQVYFDGGQLKVEQYSNDTRTYAFRLESSPKRGWILNSGATLGRTNRVYVVRPNLNGLVTARDFTLGTGYNDRDRIAFVNFALNRTRAERQTNANGITITRNASTNLMQRVGRFWLTGLGSANLTSYRYTFAPEEGRTYSTDDRDMSSAFASLGARFGITPRCSTVTSFSISRSHSVALDSTRSNGNIASTIYQLNSALILPLKRNLYIEQDYVLTATYRFFDFDESKDDLSRVFRIETTVSDTLFPFVFVRLAHRYYFFDRGEFTPLEPGGPRLYGPAQEQVQQTLDGTIGIRPLEGIILTVKQSMADTEDRDLAASASQGGEQWNLSLGLEANRTFWNGGTITGSVKREDRYQLRDRTAGTLFKEGYWLAGVTVQKDF